MKSSNLAGLVLGAVMAAAVGAGPANANTYEFEFTDFVTVLAEGFFTTGTTGSPYTVTGVSGFAIDYSFAPDASLITGLSTAFGADNLLYYPPMPSFVSTGGISFTTADGNIYNINDSGACGYSGYPLGCALTSGNNGPTGGVGVGVLFFVQETPLPSTWTMMVLGLAGLGFAAHRGRKQAATQAMG